MTATVSWRWPFWVYTILTGLCLLAIILFVEESFYDPRSSCERYVRKPRWMRLVGAAQWETRHERAQFPQALITPLNAILKIPVLSCTLYYTVIFAWNVGINNTLAEYLTTKYKFGPTSIGL